MMQAELVVVDLELQGVLERQQAGQEHKLQRDVEEEQDDYELQ